MKHVFVGFLLCLAGPISWGLEIPVRRGGPGGASVGYVDMEMVFREYPEAKKAREEYQKEVVRHKGELADRERALADLKREIDALKMSVPPPLSVERSSVTTESLAPVVSTGALESIVISTVSTEPPALHTSTGAVSVAEGIGRREEQLLKRQKELEEARESSAKALRAFEATRAKTILGRLYKALVELANERGISLVVDKSAILYGQNTIDLTEALNRRVRGLPEEEK